MHVNTMLSALQQKQNNSAQEVLKILQKQTVQANNNAKTAKQCELMPSQTKEELRQEAEDKDAILHGFMNVMSMF